MQIYTVCSRAVDWLDFRGTHSTSSGPPPLHNVRVKPKPWRDIVPYAAQIRPAKLRAPCGLRDWLHGSLVQQINTVLFIAHILHKGSRPRLYRENWLLFQQRLFTPILCKRGSRPRLFVRWSSKYFICDEWERKTYFVREWNSRVESWAPHASPKQTGPYTA